MQLVPVNNGFCKVHINRGKEYLQICNAIWIPIISCRALVLANVMKLQLILSWIPLYKLEVTL